ncbi:hypothetical protein PIB30_088907 [Stylosanthes scabra]|uniref:Putative plant transposon protein domain-containing protein n=1 Tax=Stylosanthes scabra TaxID=79078 RepID=A0ABU6TVU3_9FABA|nr:hypothetical protein [Stylosanthes scabra]
MQSAAAHPYKSYIRGVEIDFSAENIRQILRLKDHTPGAETDFKTRQTRDQELDEVLRELCVLGSTWKLRTSQPVQPIQLKRQDLFPLPRGWHEFIIHSIIPTRNKLEITIARAILIHSIINGEDVRAEELIADNIAINALGVQGKGKLAFPSTIYRLCKAAKISSREFRGIELISVDKPITAKFMARTRGRNINYQQNQPVEEEDQPEPMQQDENEHEHEHESENEDEHDQPYMHYEAPDAGKMLWSNQNNFYNRMKTEQEKTIKEIEEIKKFQVNQTLMGFHRDPIDKLEMRMDNQHKEIVEMRAQIKEWTNNASSKEAYCYWAHQQANPNLVEIPTHKIPQFVHDNAAKGRHIFQGDLKSHQQGEPS